MYYVRAFFGFLHLVASSLAGACWLLVLYALTAWIAVGTLSAIQMREAIRSDEKSITFAQLDRVREEFERRRLEIEDSLDQINYIQGQIRSLEEQKQKLERGIIEDARKETIDIVQDVADPKNLEEAVAAVNAQCGQQGVQDVKCNELKNIEDDLFGWQSSLIAINSQFQTSQKNLEQLETEFERYADLIPISTFMENWGYRANLTMPDQILVLLLTMAMGALGSVVSMTWSFINRDSGVNFRRYLFMPFVGTISAFIIFVFLKAGQITISSGDQTDPLDPFFLSFVGIISGLLSERAYTRMASLGRNFFRTEEEEQRRWGVRLSEATAAAGVGPADLAAYIGVDQNEVERMVNEKAPANLQQQRLIAACLRRSAREMFTDIPPEADQDAAEDRKVVEVPNLIGKDAATLEQDLTAAGLTVGTQREMADSQHSRGHVIAQTPPAGTRVAPKSTVDVTVSSGATT